MSEAPQKINGKVSDEEKKEKITAFLRRKQCKPLTKSQVRRALGVTCLALSLFLTGCPSLRESYVDAQIAFEAAIGPEYSAYVQADPELDDGQKALREETRWRWQAVNAIAKEEVQ